MNLDQWIVDASVAIKWLVPKMAMVDQRLVKALANTPHASYFYQVGDLP